MTNAVGCAVFSYIPVGSYDVNVRQPGWVTPTGVNDVHVSGTVSNGTTNVTTVPAYDVAGTVTLNLRTRYWDAEQQQLVDAPSRAFSFGLANNDIGTSTNVRQFKPATGAVSTLVATELFPFKDSYGLFTGQCGSENPGLAERRGRADRRPRRHPYDDRVPARPAASGSSTAARRSWARTSWPR